MPAGPVLCCHTSSPRSVDGRTKVPEFLAATVVFVWVSPDQAECHPWQCHTVRTSHWQNSPGCSAFAIHTLQCPHCWSWASWLSRTAHCCQALVVELVSQSLQSALTLSIEVSWRRAWAWLLLRSLVGSEAQPFLLGGGAGFHTAGLSIAWGSLEHSWRAPGEEPPLVESCTPWTCSRCQSCIGSEVEWVVWMWVQDLQSLATHFQCCHMGICQDQGHIGWRQHVQGHSDLLLH